MATLLLEGARHLSKRVPQDSGGSGDTGGGTSGGGGSSGGSGSSSTDTFVDLIASPFSSEVWREQRDSVVGRHY